MCVFVSVYNFVRLSVLEKDVVTTSAIVSEVEQNRAGELTHPIGRTRYM